MLIGRLLALELVDGPDARAPGAGAAGWPDLGVVRRDDEDVVPADRPFAALLSIQRRPPSTAIAPARRPRRLLRDSLSAPTSGTPSSAEPVPSAPSPRGESLDVEVRLRLEAAVVERLRRVRAEVRMEPPGRLRKRPRSGGIVGRDRPAGGPARTVGARRVAALERLIELLRVAEQDEAASRRANGDHVGQRDLAGLVDEQDVDGVGHLRRRPEPGVPPASSPGRRRAARELGRRPCRASPRSSSDLLLLAASGSARTGDAASLGRPRGPSSSSLPITLWLLAVMPTRFPAATGRRIIRAPV